jgi:hypothetical protein
VFLFGTEGVFLVRPRILDLTDSGAARGTPAVHRIAASERHVVIGVHHHRDHVPLLDPHRHAVVIVLVRCDGGSHHLRRIHGGVSREVPHQPFEIGGGGSGRECRTAPVVEHGPRRIGILSRRQLLDDKFTLPDPVPIRPRHQRLIRSALSGKARLPRGNNLCESCFACGRRLGRQRRHGRPQKQASRQP